MDVLLLVIVLIFQASVDIEVTAFSVTDTWIHGITSAVAINSLNIGVTTPAAIGTYSKNQ